MPGISTAATAIAIALMSTRPRSFIRTNTRRLVLVDGAETADPAVRAAIGPESDRDEHKGARDQRHVLQRRVEERPRPERLLAEDVHRVRRRESVGNGLQHSGEEQDRERRA